LAKKPAGQIFKAAKGCWHRFCSYWKSASDFNGEVTGAMNKGVRTLPPLDCGGTGRTPFLFLISAFYFQLSGVF
jgi:hypothetical protein